MQDLERRLRESGLWAKVQHGASPAGTQPTPAPRTQPARQPGS